MIAHTALPAAEPTPAIAKPENAFPPLRADDAWMTRTREDASLAAWKTHLVESVFQPAFS